MPFTLAVITVSDRCARGEREDLSGPETIKALESENYTLVEQIIVPDERADIEKALRRFLAQDISLIVTTGGTGFAPRDVTPEATLAVIEKRADGLSEAMRAASLLKTKYAMISRAVCGIAGTSLIINLPGSPKGVRECIDVIAPVLPHALKVLRGEIVPDTEHRPGIAQ